MYVLPTRKPQCRPAGLRGQQDAPLSGNNYLLGSGYPAHDLYVRRFWTAVLGPSAIAERLRIAQAGRSGNRIRRPIHLTI